MILSKYKLENGNYAIIYRGESEDVANDGIAAMDVVSVTYNKDADLGIMIVNKEVKSDFKEASLPLIKWMAQNQHPHTMAEIENNRAILWEGKESNVINEFILD